jgi:GTPase SAR1 family protein
MFIVIEGTDASGKTSLIEAVFHEIKRRDTGKPLMQLHKGRPTEETRRWVLKDYVNSVEHINWSQDCNGLSDRWHWGEITYAPKYRPHTNIDGFGLLGKAGWRWVELFLMSRGVASFWLYQPLDVIQRRLESRGDEFVKVEDLKEILENYSVASAVSVSLTEQLAPPADSIEQISDIAKHIVDVAEAMSEIVKPILTKYPTYIGNPTPKVLLIGDKRNITEEHGEETKLPFMPVDNNSGDFLLSALPTELWSKSGIINVADIDVDDLYDLWEDLGSPRVVCLGRNAEKGVMAAGIPSSEYDVLPHPQHVKRFNYRNSLEYGQAIQQSANNKLKEDDQWILQ